MRKGDMVRYTNPRARARFSDREFRGETPPRGGVKVPLGTEGQVFWSGTNQFGESVGVRAEDGASFFTSPRNLTLVSEAPPTPESLAPEPTRGALVTLNGLYGEIFWVGRDKRTGAWRVGVRYGGGREDVTWGNASDCS